MALSVRVRGMGDAGHYLPFEQPERFGACLLDWLAQGARAFPAGPAPA